MVSSVYAVDVNLEATNPLRLREKLSGVGGVIKCFTTELQIFNATTFSFIQKFQLKFFTFAFAFLLFQSELRLQRDKKSSNTSPQQYVTIVIYCCKSANTRCKEDNFNAGYLVKISF